jgi:hypothetical protein
MYIGKSNLLPNSSFKAGEIICLVFQARWGQLDNHSLDRLVPEEIIISWDSDFTYHPIRSQAPFDFLLRWNNYMDIPLNNSLAGECETFLDILRRQPEGTTAAYSPGNNLNCTPPTPTLPSTWLVDTKTRQPNSF